MPSFSKKEALAQFLYRSRSFLMQRKIGLLRENEFVVLTYHRIADLPAAETYPFDEELISASPSEFDWQMSFLAANFRPEKLSTLLQMCRENRKIPPGSVAVTFDDGFLDNHTVARPILSKHRVPATFFVTTDFVENNRPIWFEVVAFAFISLPVGSIRHPLCAQAAPSRATRDSRLSELSEVMRQLKKASDADRLSFVSYLMTLVDHAALDKAWKKYGGAMTWETRCRVAEGQHRGGVAHSHSPDSFEDRGSGDEERALRIQAQAGSGGRPEDWNPGLSRRWASALFYRSRARRQGGGVRLRGVLRVRRQPPYRHGSLLRPAATLWNGT